MRKDEIRARLAAAPAVERKMTTADMGGAHAYLLSIGRGPGCAVQLPRSAEWARFAELATSAPDDLRWLLAELDRLRRVLAQRDADVMRYDAAQMRGWDAIRSAVAKMLGVEYHVAKYEMDAAEKLAELAADYVRLRAIEAAAGEWSRAPGCPDHAAPLAWCDDCERAVKAAAQLRAALEAGKREEG